jgi:phosphatidate cytidylyltransferase
MWHTSQREAPLGVPESQETTKAKLSIGPRLLTALVGGPITLICCVWFGGWWAFAVVAFFVVLGVLELHNMLLHAGYRPLIVISYGLGMLFLIAAMFPVQRLLLLEIGLGVALLVSFSWLFLRKKLDGAMTDWALTLASSIYVGWPMSFFLLLRGYDSGMVRITNTAWFVLPRGAWWLLIVLLGVWGFDSAAFFSGRYFGQHKLAPAISPGKTWEGVAGGLVLSLAITLILAVVPLGLPWYLALALGLLLAVAAVLGDLAESLIKRQTHVKDSGQILPGHGGILDRIDSLLFAVIVVFVFAQLIGN